MQRRKTTKAWGVDGNAPLFLRACRRLPVERTPVWFMRQAGRYLPEYRRLRRRLGILEICERPAAAAEATLQPLRRFGLDAAILFADILLPLRPMGVRVRYIEGRGPSLDPPVSGEASARRLREPDPGELGYVLEAVRLVRRELSLSPGTSGAATPLIGFAGAPFTLASYLIEGGPSRDYLRTKAFMRSNRRAWALLMGKLARVTARYLEAQIEAGAQAVQLFDTWAGALSPADYRRYGAPYSAAVLRAVRGRGAPSIHFGTQTAGFLEDFARAGGDVIGVDWRIPLGAAFGRVGARGVQGNLDPAVLATAPRGELRRAVADVMTQAAGRPGHVFNLGHGVLPSTPVDSVQAVVDCVRELSARRRR